jgi:ubiquinone/menaquinone biosynthesis C-methylase UbiE
MLGSLRKGDWVVDVPCGTGRFFDHYARRGFIVRGIDLSADMLAQAEAKITNHQTHRLARGDIRELPFADKSCDAVVSCRVTRWLSPDDCKVAMREWQRVARKKIIFTARIANHPHARSLELFESALDGWRIARNEVGIDLDYRIICLEPV